MKTRLRRLAILAGTVVVFFSCAAWPVLAAEEGAAPDPTDTPTGLFFRWLNFVLVFGGIAYLLVKSGGPMFRARGREISQKIRETADAHAAAERDFSEAERQLAQVSVEVAELHRASAGDSAAEAERIGGLARSDAQKIAAAAKAEVAAAERAGRHELRALAARLATERAEMLLRQKLNPASQARLFRAFVAQLPRSAQ